MENQQKNIAFRLNRITTEEFATNDEQELKIENANANVNFSFRFAAEPKEFRIGVFAKATFVQNSNLFLIAEVGCHFQIVEDSWQEFIKIDKKQMLLPKKFMAHLTTITTGTLRGIVHAKTENTLYNRFVMPLVNIAEIIKDDIVIPYDDA